MVVIAIIGVLVALLLPAVQAAREAARRSQCTNQLKQLALASLLHEDAHGFFPSGGWGWDWAGDPDRGFGKAQSGGWTYSILPYMEQNQVWAMGQGVTDVATKAQFLSDMNQIQLAGFICPSRRSVEPTAIKPGWNSRNMIVVPGGLYGKSDYAINVGGDARVTDRLGGPSLSQSNNPAFPGNINWPTPEGNLNDVEDDFNGVCFVRAEIRIAQITDGTTNTYFLGEKYMNPDSYSGEAAILSNGATRLDRGDNEAIFTGFNRDNQRSAYVTPLQDRVGQGGPDLESAFGSTHPGALNMSMCDGSVQTVSYDIDPDVHYVQAVKDDGRVVGQ